MMIDFTRLRQVISMDNRPDDAMKYLQLISIVISIVFWTVPSISAQPAIKEWEALCNE